MKAGNQLGQPGQKITGQPTKDLDDQVIAILTAKKERKDLKACFMANLKLNEKISTYLAQTLEQSKKDQTFVKEVFEMLYVSSPTGDDRKDIKKEIQQMNKRIQQTIKKTTMKFLFDHLNKGQFDQAKKMISQSFDEYSSKRTLQFIDETMAVQKQSKELFNLIYKDTPQYRTDSTPVNPKTGSQQIKWAIQELQRRYGESDAFLIGIASQQFLKKRLSLQPTGPRLIVKLNYYLSILTSLNQEISFFESIKDSYERNIGAFEEFNSKLKRHKPKPSLIFRAESWKQQIVGFENRFSQLLVEVEKLRDFNKDLQSQVDNLRNNNGFQKEISESRASLQSQIAFSPSTNKYRFAGSNSRGTRNPLQCQQALMAQRQLAKNQVSKLKREKEGLQKSIERLKEQTSKSIADFKQVEKLKRNIYQNRGQKESFRSGRLASSSLKEQQNQLQADYKAMQDCLRKNQAIIKQLSQQIIALQALCQQKQTLAKELRSQLEEANQKLQSLHCQYVEQYSQHSQAAQDNLINSLTSEKEDLSRKFSEATDRMTIEQKTLSKERNYYQSRIQDLQRQLKALKENNETLSIIIKEAERKEKKFSRQAGTEIKKALIELEKSQEQVGVLRAALSRKQQQYQSLISQNQDIQKCWNSQLQQKQEQLLKSHEQKIELQQQILKLQTQLNDSQSNLQRARKEVDDLQLLIQRQSFQVSEVVLQSEEKTPESERQGLNYKQQVKFLRVKIDKLEKDQASKQRECNDLIITNKELRASNKNSQAHLQKEKRQKAQKIRELQQRMNIIKNENSQLLNSEVESGKKIRQLQQLIKSLEAENAEQKQKEGKFSDYNAKSTQRLQERIEHLEKDNIDLQAKLADKDKLARQLQERIEQIEAVKNDEASRETQPQQHIHKLDNARDILEIKLQSQQIEDLNYTINQLNQTIKALQQKVFRLEKTNKILMSEKEVMTLKKELLEFQLQEERSSSESSIQTSQKKASIFLVGIEDLGNSLM